MHKIMGLTCHNKIVRKAICMLGVLLPIVYITSDVNAQSLPSINPKTAVATASELVLKEGLNKPYTAPEFAGIENWLNSAPLSMRSLKGKVVLVDFWTYSCINCIHTIPHVVDWNAKYHDKGLVIVGVHTPEFDTEKNLDNVKAAIARYGIRYPVALDNEFATWANFNNHFWPGITSSTVTAKWSIPISARGNTIL